MDVADRDARLAARGHIFDAPTATLTPEEKHRFFEPVDRQKARRFAIVSVAHAREEALLISDRITVPRDGRHVLTGDTANFDRDKIIRSMVGRTLSDQLYNHDAGRPASGRAFRALPGRVAYTTSLGPGTPSRRPASVRGDGSDWPPIRRPASTPIADLSRHDRVGRNISTSTVAPSGARPLYR